MLSAGSTLTYVSDSVETQHAWGSAATPFEALGGETVIRGVVEDFYDLVNAEAPVLRAMLPKDDSTSRRKLGDYLIEWTGGPALYTPVRGHPRMRMRHMPFVITETDAVDWFRCMGMALDGRGISGPVRSFLDERLRALALHMVNTDEDDPKTQDRRSLDLRTEPHRPDTGDTS
jgi:hemoglobin